MPGSGSAASLVGAVGLAAVAFFVVVALAAGAALWLTGARRALRRRLAALDSFTPRAVKVDDKSAAAAAGEEEADGKPGGHGHGIGRRGGRAAGSGGGRPSGRLAGRPAVGMSPATTAVSVVAGAAFLGLFAGGSPVAALGGGLLGLLVPRFWLKRKARTRRKAFDAQIPDALALISNSLKAGYGLMQAMEMVGQEMHPPIAPEFVRTLAETRVGVSTEDALAALAARVGSEDMDLVVTAFLIQRQVGGNLAEVLDKIAFTIRERIRIRGEVRTLTAQGRLSGLIIGVLPLGIGIFLAAVNPTYVMTLFQHPLGQMMLLMAVGAEMIGVLFIKKIIAIDV